MTINFSVDDTFNLRQVNGVDYIQSNTFSAKIKHPGLVRFLKHLQENRISAMSQSELSERATECEIDNTALQEFLVNQTGLFKVRISEDTFEHLAVFGEGQVVEQLCKAYDGKFGLNVQQCKPGQEIKTDNTIIISYLPSFDAKAVEALYASSSDPRNYFVTSYLLGDHLVIDNIYSRQSGLPCHFCHLERLKVNSQLIPAGQNKSWLSYYREMLKDDAQTIFEKELPEITNNYIAYCLHQFIRRMVDPFCPVWHYDQYIEFWHVHLEKMTITKEAASFWPYCTCQNA